MSDYLSEYIPVLGPESKFSQLVAAMGFIGMIGGFIWLSIVERRKGDRTWWIELGRAIIFLAIALLILLDELGLLDFLNKI